MIRWLPFPFLTTLQPRLAKNRNAWEVFMITSSQPEDILTKGPTPEADGGVADLCLEPIPAPGADPHPDPVWDDDPLPHGPSHVGVLGRGSRPQVEEDGSPVDIKPKVPDDPRAARLGRGRERNWHCRGRNWHWNWDHPRDHPRCPSSSVAFSIVPVQDRDLGLDRDVGGEDDGPPT